MLGFASWYGHESGDQTANGEHFRAAAIYGANRTLPLPSYVEVTSLETGRTFLVRVNDRGPFGNDWRLIDLSEGAAQLLGIRRAAPRRCACASSSRPRRTEHAWRDGKPARERPTVTGQALATLRAQLKAGCAVSPDAPKGC